MGVAAYVLNWLDDTLVDIEHRSSDSDDNWVSPKILIVLRSSDIVVPDTAVVFAALELVVGLDDEERTLPNISDSST